MRALILLLMLTTTLPAQFTYPTTKRQDQVDEYHGRKVPDPYRWLENVESPETAAWVQSQNQLTFDYLAKIPERAAIHKRLTELWNYERYGYPMERHGQYFFTYNDGLQNQSPIYASNGLKGERKLVIDPNKLSSDGTVALSEWKLSDDGQLLAYSLADGGSDWRVWKVRDVKTGQDRPDEVRWVKFSDFGWTSDNQGFFYSRYDEPKADEELTGTNYFQKIYYHRLGTSQADDRLVVQRPDHKDWGFRGAVSDDGHYLVIEVWRGTENKNQLFLVDLQTSQWKVQELVTGFDAEYVYVGNDGPLFYIMTDSGADRRRVVAIDAQHTERDKWVELIPEAPETMSAITMVKDTFVVTYLKDACHEVRLFDLSLSSNANPDPPKPQGASPGSTSPKSNEPQNNSGSPTVKLRGTIDLPGLGTVAGLEGKRKSTEVFYSFTNYITPPTVFRYDLQASKSEVWQAPKLAYDPNDYVTERVFYKSKDGTRIPMIISAKKGWQRDGNNRTMLYAYGGFDISITPTFSPANLGWMDLGGVLAVPNLRGGGEYGKPWHEAGMLDRKQNVFDDYIAAAEYLIAEKVTQPKKLTISGRSNGGLLVGATMAQRPELFGVALPAVGVMDMLRFHKFTIGWAWVSEFGSSDDPKQFESLIAYSPLHNIKSGTRYPATLVTTADRDDRVVPGHSFKFAAQLQSVQPPDAPPTMIRIESRAGHGAGTPVTKLIDQAADIWSFVIANTMN